MEIKNNTIYHVPTEELKKDLLTKCEKEGIKWCTGRSAFDPNSRTNFGEEHCIFVMQNRKMEFAEKTYYETGGFYQFFPIILWEIEKPQTKPTIIKLPNNHKIVINKPYTIYTDGKVTGKAKCNPEDEWNTEVGIQVAVERYKIAKLPEPTRGIVNHFATYVMCDWGKPKTIQERFPIGSKVEMVKESDNPWTRYEIGQIATVIGHRVHFPENGTFVHCQSDGVKQVINPDDLRLING